MAIARCGARPRCYRAWRPRRRPGTEPDPYQGSLNTAVADGESLRYYPQYDVAAGERLQPQEPVARDWSARLLLVQRAGGVVTVGETDAYDEPLPIDIARCQTVQFAADAGVLPPPVFDLAEDPRELHDVAGEPRRIEDCHLAARELVQWRMRGDDRELANSLLTPGRGLVADRDTWR